ncbi:MAG: amino acid permease, partial [Lachnospiraceae bacterium]|nr:amino acid permease [Lachnospiraceae bacterium]
METSREHAEERRLEKYLSPLGVWALSFGCAVGWGAFVMPGTTFLPKAGPLGTMLGMLLGAVVMLIIGVNYHYLMNKYPDAGGTLTYTIKAFGYDHGYLSSWFLILVYVAIIWANASALSLISRKLLGSTFTYGLHYTVLGYDVYLPEVLLSLAVILVCGTVCIKGKRLAIGLQILFSLILIGGIIVILAALPGIQLIGPGVEGAAFAPEKGPALKQVFTILALSPWAFVGFESVSNSTEGFKFHPKKTIWIFAAAITAGMFAYITLTHISIAALPSGFNDWTEYIGNLGKYSGIEGLPAFYAAKSAMGSKGVFILGLAAFAGIITGLIGNYVAASRLIYSMAEDDILPKWFGRLNEDTSPGNALLFLMLVSIPVPFLGRTAIGWIVDVNTIGATIAYAYTSAAAFAGAHRENNKAVQTTGLIGVIMSVVFFLYFMVLSSGTMSTESYLILAAWSILGFLYFRHVFAMDKERRFGKSVVVWIVLLLLIFFISLVWVKHATDEVTHEAVESVSEYYEQNNSVNDPAVLADTERYLEEQLEKADWALTRNSIIQMILNLTSILIMFSLYRIMSAREKEMEAGKIKAEEGSKAKSSFLSNMSHDIRTPMNAIIGFTDLALLDVEDTEKTEDYLKKIRSSSDHLLSLINEVLEMSRIESGKIELNPEKTDICAVFEELKTIIGGRAENKKQTFTVDHSEVKDKYVLCDKLRIKQVLLNLTSNAIKYTPEGGKISVLLRETTEKEENHAEYEIVVSDNGMGMSPEFAARIFEPFEREKTSTISGIQGTGLGMAITKQFVDLMGGSISLKTSKGEGSEFTVRLRLEVCDAPVEEKEEQKTTDIDNTGKRLLLTDDIEINRKIAMLNLVRMGFTVEQAADGAEAVRLIEEHEAGYYDAVLMDIQMPVMNGYDATKAIRNLDDPGRASIPIIAMTA